MPVPRPRLRTRMHQHTRFGYIDRLSGIKKTEEYATGRRWDMRDRTEYDRRDMNPDELRLEKDKEYLERRPFTRIKVDMTKCRATDLPSCKYLIMPGPAEIRDEIQIQSEMQTYIDTLNSYLHDHCDKKGICKDS